MNEVPTILCCIDFPLLCTKSQCRGTVRLQLTGIMEHCFICYNKIQTSADERFELQDKINSNVLVVFILRKLLEIPQTFCETLLVHKGNPSDWILFCQNCYALTGKAQNALTNLKRLEKELIEIKNNVVKTISCQSQDRMNRKTNNNDTYRKIHNYFFGRLKITQHHINETPVAKWEGYCNETVDCEDYLFDYDHSNDDTSFGLDDRWADPEEKYFIASQEEIKQEEIPIAVKREVNEGESKRRYKPSISKTRNTKVRDANTVKSKVTKKCTKQITTSLKQDLKSNTDIDTDADLNSEEKIKNCADKLGIIAEDNAPRRTIRATKSTTFYNNGEDSDSDANYSPAENNSSEFEDDDSDCSTSSDPESHETKPKVSKAHRRPKEDDTKKASSQQSSKEPQKVVSSNTNESKNLPFKCVDCEMLFKYAHLLGLHRLKVHQKDMQCDQCDSRFQKQWLWKKHWKDKHPEIHYALVRIKPKSKTPIKCRICGNQIERGKYIKHRQKCQKSISCGICKKPMKNAHRLITHRLKYHFQEFGLKPLECSECGKKFEKKLELQNHMISKHTKEFTKFCPICNIGLTSGNYQSHIRRVHNGEKPFMCSVCGKSYFTNVQLTHHNISEHTKDFKFNCEICNKKFPTKHRLQSHSLMHADLSDTSHVCELCGKAFKIKFRLQCHQRGYHYKELNLEPYQCSECGRIFNTMEGVKSHTISEHKEDLKISCPEPACDKKFVNKSSLAKHMRTNHTGEKPFECGYCEKRFFMKKGLEGHVERYHTKNFSFKCSLCPLGYSDSWRLNRHMKLHHGGDSNCS